MCTLSGHTISDPLPSPMALDGDGERSRNRDLYDALMKGEADTVIRLCEMMIPKGPLHTVTIHQDTVLHMATYSKQKSLVIRLLNMVPQTHYHKLTCQNDIGNTILHEAATSDRIVPAATLMLRKAPTLLSMPNRRGETALFRAARYGKNSMFFFLDEEVKKTVESEADFRMYHVRDDKTNILHISILTEHFDLALQIAQRYTYLASERDGDGMTALQLLACNPSAVGSGGTQIFFKRFLYSRVSTEGISSTQEEVERFCRVPLWENMKNQKRSYESALALAKFLIARDTSWEATESAIDKSKPKTHRYGRVSTTQHDQKIGQEISFVDIAEAPLFLATKSGCTEIVQEILDLYPQAVEHVDDEGRNILHVAIKYRKIQIFDIVEKMEIPMMRLIRKIDNSGNSILHMVGIKAAEVGDEDMRSPALILQEDLLLFERVRKISATHFIKHYNANGQTAERLFAENNAQIRMDAKEWMKGTAENCSIVAVLIATVAFAAAYTVPGGPNDKGYPILEKHTFFIVFTMTDVLSLAFALTSVIEFLSILTSPFRLKDFQQSLPQKLMLGVTLLILSVSMMMLAFAATVILMIRSKERWTKIALYSVSFFPVSIFAASYLPLFLSLMKTFKYSLQKIGAVFPRCNHLSNSSKDGAGRSNRSQPQENGLTDSIRPSTPPTNPSLV